jgi:hypothetical protein
MQVLQFVQLFKIYLRRQSLYIQFFAKFYFFATFRSRRIRAHPLNRPAVGLGRHHNHSAASEFEKEFDPWMYSNCEEFFYNRLKVGLGYSLTWLKK